MSSELFDALAELEKEKGVKASDILESIKNAISVSIKKNYNVGDDNVLVEIDHANQRFKAAIVKDVVAEVTDPTSQISYEEAYEKNKRVKVGGIYSMKLDTKKIGRIAALSGKNLIHQGINDAIKAQLMEQYQSKLHEVINARIVKVEPKTGNATILIDKNETILFKNEQLPNERLREGEFIKVYVSDVVATDRRCTVKVSRTHRDLIKRLFEMEVPEISQGIVEIKSISRDPGLRAKIAVFSTDDNVDPIGSCIGQKFSRVSKIIDELRGEKIDIVKYSENLEEFIGQSLSPADVTSVEILNAEEKVCRVIVPDSQLSLAIGNKGQNAKLAAKLTGFKIDIRPESGIMDTDKTPEQLEEERLAKEQAEQEKLEKQKLAQEQAELAQEQARLAQEEAKLAREQAIANNSVPKDDLDMLLDELLI